MFKGFYLKYISDKNGLNLIDEKYGKNNPSFLTLAINMIHNLNNINVTE